MSQVLQFLFLLSLVLLAAVGAPWAVMQWVPDASDLLLAAVGLGCLFLVWALLAYTLRSRGRHDKEESLERRARRLAEESNRRYREAQREKELSNTGEAAGE